ncbi:MAG: nitroreductase/quinone reductase family protein [Roseiflexaceae bacterium]
MGKNHNNLHTGQARLADQPAKPPLPKIAYHVVNPVLGALLRSPLHSLISKRLMLLNFQGRKTGKRYSIPVGYLQKGRRLFVFSHSSWSKNFGSGAPVSLRLRGKQVKGTARLIQDARQIVEVVRMSVAQHGEKMAQRMGLIGADLAPSTAPAPGTTFIEIELAEPPL